MKEHLREVCLILCKLWCCLVYRKCSHPLSKLIAVTLLLASSAIVHATFFSYALLGAVTMCCILFVAARSIVKKVTGVLFCSTFRILLCFGVSVLFLSPVITQQIAVNEIVHFVTCVLLHMAIFRKRKRSKVLAQLFALLDIVSVHPLAFWLTFASYRILPPHRVSIMFRNVSNKLSFSPLKPIVVSKSPQIVRIPSFLTGVEVERIVNWIESQNTMLYSSEAVFGESSSHRFSEHMHMNREYCQFLDERVKELTAYNESECTFETWKVQYYNSGQEYNYHYDIGAGYYDKLLCDHLNQEIPGAYSQFVCGRWRRVATCLLYLTSHSFGGRTIFPAVGQKFVPVAGDLLYFVFRDDKKCTLDFDETTIHCGEPIFSGRKISIQKVIYAKE